MSMNGGGLLRNDPRAQRRAEPRMWVAIAAVGCALAVLGLFLISGDAQAGDGDGDGSPVPGIVLSLLVVLAGYALMHLLREAPAASAGVTAVILGLPGLALFLSLDVDDVPPFSIELFLGLPAIVWAVSYLVGPGKGRPVLVGFALVFAWLFVLQVAEDPFASDGFGVFEPGIVEDELGDPGFGEDLGDPGFDEDFEDDFDDEFASEDGGVSATTIGWLSVVFGAAYLGFARLFDKRGLAGTGTPFVVAGHIALIAGISALSDDLGTSGVGAVLVITGVVVARIGAVSRRRLTTIIGAVEIGLGALIVLGDSMEDSSATNFGVALFILGGVIAVLAQLLHMSTGEPPQTTPGPSSFPGWSQGNKQIGAVPMAGASGSWGGPPPGASTGPWGQQQGPAPAPWGGQQPPAGPPTHAAPWPGTPAQPTPSAPAADPRFAAPQAPPPPPPEPPAPAPPAAPAPAPADPSPAAPAQTPPDATPASPAAPAQTPPDATPASPAAPAQTPPDAAPDGSPGDAGEPPDEPRPPGGLTPPG